VLVRVSPGASESPLEPLERLLGTLAAVDARRSEEHDRVLDVLRLERRSGSRYSARI
jgi:hypothetical protein